MNRKIIFTSVFISLLLWLITSVFYVFSKQEIKPKSLETTLQQDVLKKEGQIQALLKNDSLMQHIWENKLNDEELSYLTKQSFIIHLYDTGSLTFWNNNNFPVNEKRFLPKISALSENKNVFLYQSIGNAAFKTKRINFIIPVFIHYEVENEYLKSYFFASSLIPSSSLVSLSKNESSARPILSANGDVLFYFSIDKGSIKPLQPSSALLFIILCTIGFTTISVYSLGLYIAHRKGAIVAIGLIILFLSLRLFVIYFWGLPFSLDSLDVFSPMIFGSSSFLPSLGHLFIHVYILFWLFLFINSLTRSSAPITFKKHNTLFRKTLLILTFVSIVFLAAYFENLISSLVFNSNISFDTNTFKAINKYSIFALIIISLLGVIFLLVLQVAYNIISRLTHTPFRYYIVVSVTIASLILIRSFWNYYFHQQPFFDTIVILNIIAIGLIVLQVYVINTAFAKNAFSQNGLFGHIYISVLIALLLASFFKIHIDLKEQTVYRKAFAEHLSKKQNTEFELSFESVLHKINEDNTIKEWLNEKETISAKQLEKHLVSISPYLFNLEYNQKVSLFTNQDRSLVENDYLTVDEVENIKAQCGPTLNSFLFFNPDSANNANYIAHIPIYSKGSDTLLGNVFISIRPKTFITQAVYPKILQNSNELLDKKTYDQYDFAFYQNGKLISQTGDYNFKDISAPKDTTSTYFETDNGYSIAHYFVSSAAEYLVAYKNNFWVGLLRIFSFLFIFCLLLLSFHDILTTSTILSVQQRPSLRPKSLSVRIKYFVIGFAAISFFLIGLVTILFIKSRNQTESISNIENRINNIADAIVEQVHSIYQYQNDTGHTSASLQPAISDFIQSLAKNQKTDINYFNNNGKLISSTQDLIYNDKILSTDLNPKAYHTLRNDKLKSYINPETIGALHYTAAYQALKTNNGTILGFINIPSFYANEDLDAEILQLLTTFTIIYALLIILSSVIIFIFVSRISKSLAIVTEGLKTVNLSKNEPIHWPYHDEIGQLVTEFNKMLATVEQNTKDLIVDERQNAWREMAQQVAHEIKNPLTPMKLNMQYLQQAINTNQPNVIDLTQRVSASIIEQIDNLNYIATEFSSFAKMPENDSEKIDLKALLSRTLLLFSGNENVSITQAFPPEAIHVFVDKSQMLRIVNNIVQNAVEAMPAPPHKGLVNISLQHIPHQHSILLIVSDNGTGIPEDIQTKIFEPYFTTKSSGTGLGLAMSRKMIQIWGGTINCQPNSLGGASFHIILPLC